MKTNIVFSSNSLTLILFQKPFLLCTFQVCVYLTYFKSYFQWHQLIFFEGSANLDPVVFGNDGFGNSKTTIQQRNLFKNIFCYGRFKYASTLRKNIFSAAPVKCFFIHGKNNSYSVVFSIEEKIEDHGTTTTHFQKKFLLWNYQICI